MILIISHPRDEHAAAVQDLLHRVGQRPLMIDLSRFPTRSLIEMNYGVSCNGALNFHDDDLGKIDMADCRVAWWRRPQPFDIPPQVTDPSMRFFAANEAREAFWGLWGMLDVNWINDPFLDDKAHRKPYQLWCAEELGLNVPRTLITNNPTAANNFIESLGDKKAVFKAFVGSPHAWRETRIIGNDELDQLSLVKLAPVIFQEYLDGVDVRVTVVGSSIFAAEIEIAANGYKADFRMNYDNIKIRAIRLPESIEDQIKALMCRLELVYGAIDFRRTDDGRYIFLEINPAGQWLFIEQKTQLPITKAFADTLIALNESKGPCEPFSNEESPSARKSTNYAPL